MDLLAVQGSSHFKQLDKNDKKSLEELLLSRESLTKSLQQQESVDKMRHIELSQKSDQLLNKSQRIQEENQRREADIRLSMQSSQESLAQTLSEQQETREDRLKAEMKSYLEEQKA